MTLAAGYPLSRALPSDVALGGESIAAFYQRYPIFSWPWAWRRLLLFLPFAIVPALIRGMSHGASVNDMADTLNITVRYVGTNLVAIGLGPLAAAMVRHARLALRAYLTESERWHEHRRQEQIQILRRQRDAADMQLSVLQAQVEPHFLFNTLASVRSLVGSDPRRAAETIDALAEHLRATLPKLRAEGRAALSTLGEQFAICESYLTVMRVRMGDRLRATVTLPEELRSLPFPPLMLISLVENAIKHGAEPKTGPVEVRLEAAVLSRTGEQVGEGLLQVRVIDDGVGLSVGMGQGTGLANIRAQLQNRFGDEATLDLTARDSGGVIATLSIPITRLEA
jgi:sensor histidine kinase YesM